MSAEVDGGRLGRLRDLLFAAGIDAFVVSGASNLGYLSGFTGSNGQLAITLDSTTLITDARYAERALDELAAARSEVGDDIDVAIAPGAGHDALSKCLDRAVVIGLEADHLSWTQAESLNELLGPDRVRKTSGVVEELREFKSEAEVALMSRAATIADRALAEVVDCDLVGKAEREVKQMLDRSALEFGADGASFDTIVASGPNGARPHHEAGGRILAEGDLVIIDFGAEVNGYRSDMTRSFVLGQPTDQQRHMLDAVHEAQRRGVEAVAAGVATSQIDAACRSVLADMDLAEFFVHGTGHGVGLDIHESPSVSATSTATLAPGHVITVEPGVYIPNVGGVRFEDTVLVTSTGAEVLTHSPKKPMITL